MKEMKKKKGEKKEEADVLEPEKCPLPREVGPFFPLLTGGENIYKTNRAHITSESPDTADSKTHLCTNSTDSVICICACVMSQNISVCL